MLHFHRPLTSFRALTFIRPLVRPVTYTRWLHLCIPMAFVAIWMFIDMERLYIVLLLAVPIGLVPAVRLEEGIQAQLLLTPQERGKPDASIAVAPATTWQDRGRTVLWLEARLLLSGVATIASVWLPMITIDLISRASGGAPTDPTVLGGWEPHWWYALLAVIPVVVLFACLVVLGELVTHLAHAAARSVSVRTSHRS